MWKERYLLGVYLGSKKIQAEIRLKFYCISKYLYNNKTPQQPTFSGFVY